MKAFPDIECDEILIIPSGSRATIPLCLGNENPNNCFEINGESIVFIEMCLNPRDMKKKIFQLEKDILFFKCNFKEFFSKRNPSTQFYASNNIFSKLLYDSI